ncbi:hypothetical protein Tco_0265368 [Tanacetum coccineum]
MDDEEVPLVDGVFEGSLGALEALEMEALVDVMELNTTYPLPSDTAYPVLCLIHLTMTKVIKGEFEKIMDIKVEDVSLTCDTQLEVFNNEVNRLSRMDDDSEHEADDDMGYDPSDIRGVDEVELTDEESDDEDEIAEVFRIDTNIFDYETPLCSAFNEFNYLLKVDPDLLTKDIMGFKTYEDYKDDWIYELNKDVPWVDEKPWTNTRVTYNEDDEVSRYEQQDTWKHVYKLDDAYEIKSCVNNEKKNYSCCCKEEICQILLFHGQEAMPSLPRNLRILNEGMDGN